MSSFANGVSTGIFLTNTQQRMLKSLSGVVRSFDWEGVSKWKIFVTYYDDVKLYYVIVSLKNHNLTSSPNIIED